ncbi:hypothetical protein AT03_05135 [Hafnia alvei FB1]|uniref:Uncharacterized protein n=1 Tax=Hafnia alvei FB1 TaxID=1453496 RepID=A0A097QZB4_HAFAL|nr:hypothetical protein AT03_05135 [Hafnia alvei FB1]
MKNNIYDEVRELTHELENTGNDSLISSILDSIDFSSTSTEALFKIRFYLSQINKGHLNNYTTEKVTKIENEINKLLE